MLFVCCCGFVATANAKYVEERDAALLGFRDRYEVYGLFEFDELPDYYDD
jgi:hypothetical protein